MTIQFCADFLLFSYNCLLLLFKRTLWRKGVYFFNYVFLNNTMKKIWKKIWKFERVEHFNKWKLINKFNFFFLSKLIFFFKYLLNWWVRILHWRISCWKSIKIKNNLLSPPLPYKNHPNCSLRNHTIFEKVIHFIKTF